MTDEPAEDPAQCSERSAYCPPPTACCSVVVPVYHNAESLRILHQRLVALEAAARVRLQIIYVDDGSSDESYAVLAEIAAADERVRLVRLSRNFGSFTAIRAGLDHAHGSDCVAVISADLQDPPEHLAAMVDAWRAGNKVVLAVRRRRDDNLAVRLCSGLYYRLVRRWALPEMPPGGFDFFLVDRQVADVLCQLQERNTSLVGLVLWLGYRKALLPYERQARPFGRSMWSLRKKLNYFVDTFVAFTVAPLRLASAVGVAAAALSFGWCAFVVLQAALLGRPFPGWSSLMAAVCFLGGVQLLSLGIIGEYLWRNLEESRRRPLYLIDHTVGGGTGPATIPLRNPRPPIIAASGSRR